MGKGQLMEKYKTRHHVILTIRETEGIRIPGDHQIEINNAPVPDVRGPFERPPGQSEPTETFCVEENIIGIYLRG